MMDGFLVGVSLERLTYVTRLMERFMRQVLTILFVTALTTNAVAQEKEKKYLDPIIVQIPHISTDKTVKYDYDIVYVRAKRAGDKIHKRFYTDFSSPVTLEPGADLMLLHPDGTEELLTAGGEGSITDPMVSFDGQWVYYTRIYNLKGYNQWNPPKLGACPRIHTCFRGTSLAPGPRPLSASDRTWARTIPLLAQTSADAAAPNL